MSLIYGIEAIHQSASANLPHVLGFQTARTASDDTLFEVWNASTNAGIKAAVDLNGKYYSAAWTAGDIPYAVTGGVANVRRLDSLGIGTAYQVLQTNSGATAPEWTSSPTVTSLTLSGTLTLTGATVAGAPTWNSTQTLNTSGLAGTATALATARTINGVAFDGTSNITVTAAAGTLSGNTLAAGVTASSLTSVGTLTGLTVTTTSAITITVTGTAVTELFYWTGSDTFSANSQNLKGLWWRPQFINSGAYTGIQSIAGYISAQWGSSGSQTFTSGKTLVLSGGTAGTVTLTEWIGLDITEPAGATGSSFYGIRIQNIAGGSINKAIETGTGLVRFGDEVWINGNLEFEGDLNHNGSNIGFFGTAPTTIQDVTGSRGSNAALASLLTALAAYGILTDSSS